VAEKQYLITPGPTPVPPEVAAAIAQPVVHHRSPDFKALLSDVLAGLQRVFATQNPVLLMTASGTAAMESAVVNLLGRGERAVVASAGNFGERWAAIAEAHEVEVVHLRGEWGERLDPDTIATAVGGCGARVVFVTHSETSTGVVNDVQAIAAALRPAGAMLVVDAVSSLGGIPLMTDLWGVDVVVAGSQKALMTPPGLAFASISERARAAAAGGGQGRFYLDWEAGLRAQEKGQTAFTPAVGLVQGLAAALELIERRGIDRIWAHNRRLAQAAREGVRALGLELFSPDDDSSAMVTAVRMPDGLDGQEVYARLRDRYHVVLAGGQGPLRGQIMRIGHMGDMDEFAIVTALAGLGLALHELGYGGASPGAGAARAVEVFASAEAP
jgi:serine---pyruvate transaminase